ncbi:MAG: phosphoglucosamine mutase [Opitutales bacterium]
MKVEHFGTDGIRGPAGGDVVNPFFAARLGLASGNWAKGNCPGSRLVLIGRDTRHSGPDLLAGLASGLVSEGLEVRSLGILPTPALALAVTLEKACLGIMITASHNPASDNGFKLFDHLGHKLSPEDESGIESVLPEKVPDSLSTPADDPDSLAAYLEHLAAALPEGSLKDWTIALDTAHGATARVSRIALERLGAVVKQIGDASGNQLINDGVGSESPKRLASLVRETNARLGIAHDGDGDRVIFCDENGVVVEGDCILGILALDAGRREVLGSATLVTTDYANHGLNQSLSKHGITVERTGVGDRRVADRMREIGAAVGGEPSGHLILSEWSSVGDGPMAALNLARIMLEREESLSKLKDCVHLFPSFSKAFPVAEKIPLEEFDEVSEQIREQNERLGKEGRVFVRYSGTEPKIRLLVEAREEALALNAFGATERILRKELKFL